MTLSTSAVAVCCCSDSPQLVEQPRVLDGDDGLAGEARQQLDLLVGERPHLLAIDGDRADQLVSLSIGTSEDACGRPQARPTRRARIALDIGRVGGEVGDVNDLLVCSDAPEAAIRAADGSAAGAPRCRDTPAARRAAQPGGSASPSRRYRLPKLASQIRVAFASMASNTGSSSPGELEMTLQHLGGRGLLLQRLATARRCAPAPRRTAARSRSRSPPGRRRSVTSSICLSVKGRTS